MRKQDGKFLNRYAGSRLDTSFLFSRKLGEHCALAYIDAHFSEARERAVVCGKRRVVSQQCLAELLADARLDCVRVRVEAPETHTHTEGHGQVAQYTKH